MRDLQVKNVGRLANDENPSVRVLRAYNGVLQRP